MSLRWKCFDCGTVKHGVEMPSMCPVCATIDSYLPIDSIKDGLSVELLSFSRFRESVERSPGIRRRSLEFST